MEVEIIEERMMKVPMMIGRTRILISKSHNLEDKSSTFFPDMTRAIEEP